MASLGELTVDLKLSERTLNEVRLAALEAASLSEADRSAEITRLHQLLGADADAPTEETQ